MIGVVNGQLINGCSPSPTAFPSRSAARTAFSIPCAKSLPPASGTRFSKSRALRPHCRHGKSCANGGRPLPPSPSRRPGGRVLGRAGAIFLSPGTGPRKSACRRRSKGPSAPAIALPNWHDQLDSGSKRCQTPRHSPSTTEPCRQGQRNQCRAVQTDRNLPLLTELGNLPQHDGGDAPTVAAQRTLLPRRQSALKGKQQVCVSRFSMPPLARGKNVAVNL